MVMNPSNSLMKCCTIPSELKNHLLDTDVLFISNEFYIAVSEELGEELYVPIYERNLIRVNYRLIKILDDTEINAILFRAKLERDFQHLIQDEEFLFQAVDDIMIKKYPHSLLSSIDQKIEQEFAYDA